MALDIGNLINDYNGAILLSPGHAEWGYVDPGWYLQIPLGANLGAIGQHALGVTPFGPNLNANNFLKANYSALFALTGNADKSLFGALLRYHFARQGMIDADLGRRGVVEDEYAVRANLGADWNDPLNNIPANPNSQAMAKWIKKYGNIVCFMLSYVFTARGHHWEPEFDELYTRLMRASFVVKPTTWTFPSNEELFRLMLHCFGIKIPFDFTIAEKTAGRMVHPMAIRFQPHAPVAGAAQITTSVAILREMRTEGWWGSFEAKFQAHVDTLANEATTIALNPYEYHVASLVLTSQPKRNISPASLVSFNRLSQFMLGYLDHIGRRHPLSNQKVITSKSGGLKPLAESFARACDKYGKPGTDPNTMALYLTQV